jgi:pimeloyl-ACP methyl ester carboxylesterase
MSSGIIIRSMSSRRDPRLVALRAAFRTVGPLAPALAARWAEALFCRPPRQVARANEEAFIASGRAFAVEADGHRYAAWEWGAGPTVLAVHGWGSRAGRFHLLAAALAAAGRRVVAFDAPGHGRSTGRRSSMIEFARAVRAVAEAAGPVHGVVGHSLGGAAIALALSEGLEARRAALIATPADPGAYSVLFAELLGIPTAVREAMQRNLESRFSRRWSDLHVPTLVRGAAIPALVVHDADDHDVPWREGEAIAASWPGAELVTTHGLGHRAILRDPAVVERVTAFLSA